MSAGRDFLTKLASDEATQALTDLYQRFLCAALSACAYSIGNAAVATEQAFAAADRMMDEYLSRVSQ